jgi:hypothetical protein
MKTEKRNEVLRMEVAHEVFLMLLDSAEKT